jgi:hypothetical protein
MFSYFLRFYISVLEIYISNLGARPVLVHFWEYIFRNWITVQSMKTSIRLLTLHLHYPMCPLVLPTHPQEWCRGIIVDQVLLYPCPINAKVERWELDTGLKNTIKFIPFYYPLYYTILHLSVVTPDTKSATKINNISPDNLSGPVLPYRMISFK